MEKKQLTDEQKKQLSDFFEDQTSKFGEIFAQCWDSDDFKAAFIKDPKATFEEYGVSYDKEMNYLVIDSPAKTMIHVLPYKGVKSGIQKFTDILKARVDDLDDKEEKQILLPGWSWQVFQNTEDTCYVVIPPCPESLTPEELEMVNGGCLFAGIIVVGAVIVVGVAAVFNAVAVSATTDVTGTFIFNGTAAIDVGDTGFEVDDWYFSQGADKMISTISDAGQGTAKGFRNLFKR